MSIALQKIPNAEVQGHSPLTAKPSSTKAENTSANKDRTYVTHTKKHTCFSSTEKHEQKNLSHPEQMITL